MMKMNKNVVKDNPMLDLTEKIIENHKNSLDDEIKRIIRHADEEIEELKVLKKQLNEFKKNKYKASGIIIIPRLCNDSLDKELHSFVQTYSTYQTLKMIAEKGSTKNDVQETEEKQKIENLMIDYSVSVMLFRNYSGYDYGFRFDTTYEDYDKAWDEFVKQVELAKVDKKHRLKIELYEESHSPDPCVEEGPFVLYHYETGKIYRHDLRGWEDSFEEVTGDWKNQGYHPAWGDKN